MSAEMLRKAAALMRERAEAATPSDGTHWGDGKGYSPLSYARQNDAEHIASWHPAVALAVADWLDAEAAEFEKLAVQSAAVNLLLEFADETVAARIGIGYNTLTQAIAVARAYLGEA